MIKHWWNATGTGSTQRETCHCTILSLVSPTRNVLGSKPGLRIEGPATYASVLARPEQDRNIFNPLKPELNPICYLLALLGAHHFLHVSRIRVKLLTFRLLMSYIYAAPILDVSRSHTTTQHSR